MDDEQRKAMFAKKNGNGSKPASNTVDRNAIFILNKPSVFSMGLMDWKVEGAIEDWFEEHGKNLHEWKNDPSGMTQSELKELITDEMYYEGNNIDNLTKDEIENSPTFKDLYDNYSWIVTKDGKKSIRKISKQKDFKLGTLSDAEGTHLQGYVYDITYDELVKIFGKPSYQTTDSGYSDSGTKVHTEWNIVFDNPYEVATIYDWKSDINPAKQTDWHIGGHDKNAVHRIDKYIAGERVTYSD